MKKILVVVDMQNDFITGPLGTPEAVSIVDKVVGKIRGEEWDYIYATLDTHFDTYLKTQEGRMLPVEHCVIDTEGHKLNEKVSTVINRSGCKAAAMIKNTFGSTRLIDHIGSNFINAKIFDGKDIELTLVGVCTDICVISNALLLKAHYPEMKIVVDASCCAGSSPKKHRMALEVMKSCQIDIVNDINPVEFLEKHFVMPDPVPIIKESEE